MGDVLLREREGRIQVLTLNRPDKLNALSVELQVALRAAVDDLATDASADCVLLRGAGRSFCAGFDLGDLSEVKDRLPWDFGTRLMSDLAALPQPVIAAVHGHCYTGGMELALACDFIVAAEGTRFRDTHASLGLHALWGMTQRLPRRIGAAAAKDMMFTSRVVGGREALALGLVTRCLPDEGFHEAALACAREVAACPGSAVRWVKSQVEGAAHLPLDEALRHELDNRPAGGERAIGSSR